jgi:hypothetical protein
MNVDLGVIRVSVYVNLDDIIGIFSMAQNGQTIPIYSRDGV